MNTSETEADLPAPLSLTLDEVREVAGGTTTLAVRGVAIWWCYGPRAGLPATSQATLPGNVAVGGAGQVLGG
jgi:hypothetical protein